MPFDTQLFLSLSFWQAVHMDFSQYPEALGVALQTPQTHVCAAELQVKGQGLCSRGTGGKLGAVAVKKGGELLFHNPLRAHIAVGFAVM